jgi:hypothetical protein
MALFYSQGMRKVLMSKTKQWDMSPKLRKVFTDILKRRYKSAVMKQHAYLFFKVMSPEEILRILHEESPETFNFNPYKRIGYINVTYVPRLLTMFCVKTLHLDAVVKGKTLQLYLSVVYAGLNLKTVTHKKPTKKRLRYVRVYEDKKVDVDVSDTDVVVIKFFDPVVRVTKENLFAELPLADFESSDSLILAGREYVHDNMLLSNFNMNMCAKGHDIAGVTCENERFLYNGWTRSTIDPALKAIKADTAIANASALPCELMPFDWVQNRDDFCLDTAACGLRKAGPRDQKRKLCFNISKGNITFMLVSKKYRK